MKLQYLAIIFLIIILPIVMVLSIYVDYHIDAINMKHTYDTKLLDATYDALKSYQLNTVNNAISDISASKIEELEAAVKAFYNSLSTTYGYTGYKSSVMEDYVPAVVFAMYDGYYIYSPYRNVLTGVSSDDVDEAYEDNKILKGLKSYVYYSCRYKKDLGAGKKFDVVITYTLDNYITIQGTVNGKYINKYGYLIDGITEDQSSWEEADINNDGTNEKLYNYTYDGITYTYSNKNEELKEYLGDTEYSYAKINGTKYYLSKDEKSVFYINASGEKAIQASTTQSPEVFEKYKNFIKNNNSAYRYYHDAYIFTKWVRDNLGGLSSTHALDAEGNSIDEFADYTIFGEDENDSDNKTSGPDSNKYIQDLDSDFNAHRSAVIRYTITKNLSTAIAGYNNYFNNSEAKFIMPNISETDWEIIENNISMITFLQGFKIGGRDYNEYCVVANNLNKEFVSEDDIYVLGNDYTYYKVNDKTISDLGNKKWFGETTSGNNYAPGVWKLNFENKVFLDGKNDENYIEKKYYPISYKNNPTSSTEKPKAYIGSYSSVIASTSVDTSESDMYKYMRNKADGDGSPSTPEEELNAKLKTVYYTALARERYGQYSVNNEIDIKPGELKPPETPEVFEDDEIESMTLTAQHEEGTENWVTLDDNKWTRNNVKLIGSATDTKSKIKGYAITQENKEPSNYNAVSSKEELSIEQEIGNNDTGEYTYYFYVKDGSNNIGVEERTIHIDKTSPVISEFVEDEEEWTKGPITLTGNIKDEHSGITKYAITNSSSTPSKYDKTIQATTEEITIDKEISENGTYYLHVRDQAGNTSYKQLEVGNIDTTSPTVTVNPTSSQACKNTQITITLSDAESGLESEEGICYLSKYNEEIDKTEYEYYDFKSGETLTIGEGLTGVYELWVEDVSDRAGNTNEKHLIGEFIFDNEAPIVQLDIEGENENEETILKDQNIIITFSDSPSGLASNNGKCYLSTSADENTKTKEYEYTSGTPIKIGKQLTGKYYIWVDSVSDKLGNETGEVCIGELTFDNEAPTVEVTPTSANLCKNTNITIKLKDNGSGLKSEQGTYYWSLSKSSNDRSVSGTYTSNEAFTAGDNLTGTYYLWVGDVEDNAGNINREHCVGGPYIFDNTAPTISSFEVIDTDENTISVKTTASDVGTAGIKSYEYYILKPNSTEYMLSGTVNNSDSYKYTDSWLKVGEKYKIYVVVTDNLGNSSKSNILEANCQNTTYKITYNFAPNPGEQLYKDSVSNENKISYTSVTRTYNIRQTYTLYSDNIIKLDSVSGQMWSINYWVDDTGREYPLNSQYSSPTSKNLNLYAVWQKKNIRLTNEQVNVNLYWDRQSIDIDTHLYGYNDINAEQDLYLSGKVYKCRNANYHIYYVKKSLGTAINLDTDDQTGGTGENILIDLNQLNNKYSNIQKMIINGQSYSKIDFNKVKGLKVIITNKTNSIQLFSYDLTQVSKQILKVGTLTKDRRRMDICRWRFIEMED